MPLFNAVTGLKRKLPSHRLPRKKRASHSSTVAGGMCAEEAMKNCHTHMTASKQHFMFLMVALQSNHMHASTLTSLSLVLSAYFFSRAMRMLQLDSELMDIHEDTEETGHHNSLVGINLDTHSNDDECVDRTRFKKAEMRMIVEHLDLPPCVRLCHCQNKCHKFYTEELLICMLREFSTGRAHEDLTQEFGGCAARWGRGCSWLVKHIDNRFAPLMGPDGLSVWADDFPCFAEQSRQFVVRDKMRTRSNGEQRILNLGDNETPQGTFNVMSFTDCTHYEHCRPGSGPRNDEEAAPRRPGWHFKQRAFYTAHQRGMEASVKILTICLPNGMCGAVYGPTSGRKNDLTLFRPSDLDTAMRDLCIEHHGGDLHCTHGDGIFAGCWFCVRTKHVAPPGMELTDSQKLENDNLASARISVEWSHARAEKLFPMLTIKSNCQLEVDALKSFAEIRVMHLFTNFKVCCCEGSTVTGTRMFRCPPPGLEECLNGLNN